MVTLRLLPELEEAIRRLPGVRAASVVTGPDARPTEVHVLAGPDKPAKQVVRDVQSLALVQLDIDLDHRMISVVQLDDGDLSPRTLGSAAALDAAVDSRAGGRSRPAVESISVRTRAGVVDVEVALRGSPHLFVGTATGPSRRAHRPRVVAAAAIAAVEELLGIRCDLESTGVIHIDGRDVALTVLSLTDHRMSETLLTGSALVGIDEADAVVRSILDALNRRLDA